MVPAAAQRTSCPSCGARVPVHEGWVSWCECGWNLEPAEAEPPRGLPAQIRRRLGEKHGAALCERLVRHEPSRPPFRPTRVLLVALALLVLASYVAIVALALALLVRGWPNPFVIAGGLALLLVAYRIRPRTSGVDTKSLATPASHPEIHRFARAVAGQLRVPAPARIALVEEYNAWMGRTGWRQIPTLGLGVPMLYALEPEQWVALVGHELAHLANGDVTRSGIVAYAIHTLDGWYATLEPQSIREAEAADSLIGVLLFHALSWIPRSMLALMLHLSWHDSQQAEYYADRLGADASGTTAFTGMLASLHDYWMVDDAVHRVARGTSKRRVLDELAHRIRTKPERARERARLRARREPTALDSTHPPTGLRLRMLEARPRTRAALSLRPRAVDAILREIEPDARRVEEALLADHESYSPM